MVSDDLIRQLVMKAFSSEVLEIRELSSGFKNSTYAVILSTGREVALKLSRRREGKLMRFERDRTYAEVTALLMMKHYPEIPTPQLYYYDATGSLFDGEFFFMEYMMGENYSSIRSLLNRVDEERIEHQLGSLNRKVNNICGQYFGSLRKNAVHHPDWFTAFQTYFNDVVESSENLDIDLYIHPETLERRLKEDRACFNEVVTPKLIHWDLGDNNVFVKCGQVSGIIDWERCLYADPLMECNFRTEFNTPAFNAGYGKESFTKSEKRRIYWYDAYFYLITLVECRAQGREKEEVYQSAWKGYIDALEHLQIIREY